jgi:hypothetical protein
MPMTDEQVAMADTQQEKTRKIRSITSQMQSQGGL